MREGSPDARRRGSRALFGPVQAVAVILLLLVALSASLTMLVAQAANYAAFQQDAAVPLPGSDDASSNGSREGASSAQPSDSDAGDVPGEATSASSDPPPTSSLVDVNTADETLLDTLPGVGPAIARRIIEYRASHGRFSSIDELLEVSGIGEKTLERLRPLVSAS
ncbi:helix-hairpin-helix domain-containing protein [uncultured Bifidobacterium sp.]|uniref:ComEA family DNA-binding protein n=1 Tax=uncultured Bifidobacterium sp. TaxID=165187 RepID=UPI0028DBB56A|nr:helix-hairpin-helix domain-containing protein [uncultured Bifidobacterium sp.]